MAVGGDDEHRKTLFLEIRAASPRPAPPLSAGKVTSTISKSGSNSLAMATLKALEIVRIASIGLGSNALIEVRTGRDVTGPTSTRRSCGCAVRTVRLILAGRDA
jgi:hypothetical protein